MYRQSVPMNIQQVNSMHSQQLVPMHQQSVPMQQEPVQMYQQPVQIYQQPMQMYQQPEPMQTEPAPMYHQPVTLQEQPAPTHQQLADETRPQPWVKMLPVIGMFPAALATILYIVSLATNEFVTWNARDLTAGYFKICFSYSYGISYSKCAFHTEALVWGIVMAIAILAASVAILTGLLGFTGNSTAVFIPAPFLGLSFILACVSVIGGANTEYQGYKKSDAPGIKFGYSFYLAIVGIFINLFALIIAIYWIIRTKQDHTTPVANFETQTYSGSQAGPVKEPSKPESMYPTGAAVCIDQGYNSGTVLYTQPQTPVRPPPPQTTILARLPSKSESTVAHHTATSFGKYEDSKISAQKPARPTLPPQAPTGGFRTSDSSDNILHI
ncbi:hypothetical protein SARC_06247 [Sphaeroforma arctica JP610]|uniref:Uncharacterized protein n=1 Tax=Sphaeroforma arctica JP610 TaxID=667725 RepID=A0A0L0FXZ2_9EUKA|nr:hypothetical protein SARC_06247 [Sphaeroforma arctica JP610]KNC81431.1 hypothetical protein SARC_06247 [Sphaeroforma arctica JP610]|eukprot:XP_014155333.1 hypothetical protein SARC_06247 [Sphaeroforma arctica JP610]